MNLAVALCFCTLSFPLSFMKLTSKEPDSYILDTYKADGQFRAGAIILKGRKRIEIIQWKDHVFSTQEEANAFVHKHCVARGLFEARPEGEIQRKYAGW